MALLCMFAVRGGQGRGDARERERETGRAPVFFENNEEKYYSAGSERQIPANGR